MLKNFKLDLETLLSIDRRIIFLTLTIVVIIPTVLKVEFPLSDVSNATRELYEMIDNLEAGSCVWLVLDYKPEAMAEVQPQLTALLNHCFSRDIKVLGLNPLIAESTPLGTSELRKIGNKYDKKEHIDYVYLGYRPGGLAVMLGLGKEISKVYKTDITRTELSNIPMMKNIRNYDDADLLVSIAAFKTPGYWVQYVGGRFGVKVAAGVTGVMVPDMYPLFNSGQLVGILPGLRGAAEYEKLMVDGGHMKKTGIGSAGMSIQTVVHYALVLLIIFCNTAYFILRYRETHRVRAMHIENAQKEIGMGGSQ